MTNDKMQTADNEHPMLRLARRLANTMTAEYRMLLAGVAADGDIELARALHEAGLLANSGAKTALLSLPQHAQDRAAALDLIREIISINGKLTRSVDNYYFTNARTEDAVRTLGELGCNPNQWIDTNPSLLVTPLSAQLDRIAKERFPSAADMVPALEILEVLRRREVVPLIQKDCYDEKNAEQKDFFQAAAHTAIFNEEHTLYPSLMDQLVRQEWPDSWRRAAGSAVLEYASEPQPIQSNWQITQVANLLSMAKFDNAKTWHDLFACNGTSKGLVSNVVHWLSDTSACGASGVAAVRNMMEHGVSLDKFTVDFHVGDGTGRGTLLHSAIVEKNLPMVESLVEAGADTAAIVSRHPHKSPSSDIGLSAIELAEKRFPDALPMLYAKRAKDAITRTIDHATTARKTGIAESQP